MAWFRPFPLDVEDRPDPGKRPEERAPGSGDRARRLHPSEPAPIERPEMPGVLAPPSRPRVLIVDDEAKFLTSLERALARHNDVVSASSGEQAIQLLGDGLQVDLVISDLVLPGKSGMDIHACIQNKRPDLARRLLFLTGGVTTPQGRRFVADNLDSVLMKPVDTARLDAIIHAVAGGVAVQSAIEQTRPRSGS